MIAHAIMILGLIVNTTLVDKIDDVMIENGKIVTPIIIRIDGDIGEGSAETFVKRLIAAQQTGQSVIPIVISSFGGSVYDLFKMVDIIDKVKKTTPIATIVIGKAMSAGAVLSSCGTEGMRFASPTSTIMIHEVSSGTSGKVGEIEASAKETERLNTILLEIISVNIGKPKGYIADVIQSKGHADWYLSPEQAMEHNVINKIGIPDLIVKAKVTVTLE